MTLRPTVLRTASYLKLAKRNYPGQKRVLLEPSAQARESDQRTAQEISLPVSQVPLRYVGGRPEKGQSFPMTGLENGANGARMATSESITFQDKGEFYPPKVKRTATHLVVQDIEAVADETGHWKLVARTIPTQIKVDEFNNETRELGVGVPGKIGIPRLWLRDHCQCGECVNPVTKQRTVDTFSLDPRIRMVKCTKIDNVVYVEWEHGHKSRYSVEWLIRAFDITRTHKDRASSITPIWWSDVDLENSPPQVWYQRIMESDAGLRDLILKIQATGFCFVDECPATPEATKALLERIGPIRNTHYGTYWESESNMSSKDTAYTNLKLDLHTDTNYFSEPVALEMFHCLKKPFSGGASQFVDGYNAAYCLWKADRAAYNILSTSKTFFHSSGNEGISIQPQNATPTFVHDPVTKVLNQVRWNNADRAAMLSSPTYVPSKTIHWYDAMRKFNTILQDRSLRYEIKLVPRRPIIFDNWRVLHGRSAFEGSRKIAGGYISRDDYMSRFRTLSYGWEEVNRTQIY